MKRADSLLKHFFSDLGIEEQTSLSKIKLNWQELIGDPLSSHTFPAALTRGEFLISVDSPAWLQELNFHREVIAGKLRGYGVSSVRLKLGKMPPKSAFRRKIPLPQNRDLTEEESAFIQEALHCISEGPIKETFRSTMKKAIASGKTKIERP